MDLNPGPARHDGGDVTAGAAAAAPTLTEAYAALRADLSGLRQLHRPRVTQPLNVGGARLRRAAGQRQQALQPATTSRGCRTRCRTSRGNTTGNGVADERLPGARRPAPRSQRRADRTSTSRHNFVVSGRAVIPKTGGLNVSWVARALSGTPFTLINNTVDPDRNGSLAEPLPAGNYSGTGAEPLHGRRLQGGAQRRLRPRVLQPGHARELCPPASARAGSS